MAGAGGLAGRWLRYKSVRLHCRIDGFAVNQKKAGEETEREYRFVVISQFAQSPSHRLCLSGCQQK